MKLMALFYLGFGRFYINSVFAALCFGIVVGAGIMWIFG